MFEPIEVDESRWLTSELSEFGCYCPVCGQMIDFDDPDSYRDHNGLCHVECINLQYQKELYIYQHEEEYLE